MTLDDLFSHVSGLQPASERRVRWHGIEIEPEEPEPVRLDRLQAQYGIDDTDTALRRLEVVAKVMSEIMEILEDE